MGLKQWMSGFILVTQGSRSNFSISYFKTDAILFYCISDFQKTARFLKSRELSQNFRLGKCKTSLVFSGSAQSLILRRLVIMTGAVLRQPHPFWLAKGRSEILSHGLLQTRPERKSWLGCFGQSTHVFYSAPEFSGPGFGYFRDPLSLLI